MRLTALKTLTFVVIPMTVLVAYVFADQLTAWAMHELLRLGIWLWFRSHLLPSEIAFV